MDSQHFNTVMQRARQGASVQAELAPEAERNMSELLTFVDTGALVPIDPGINVLEAIATRGVWPSELKGSRTIRFRIDPNRLAGRASHGFKDACEALFMKMSTPAD